MKILSRSVRVVKNSLAAGLCLLLASTLVSAQTIPTEISLVVTEGEGAIHGPNQRVGQAPTVRVEDENGRGVEEAIVVFTLPTSGPSGAFSGGAKSLTISTGSDGLAKASGLQTNHLPGKLQILVAASYRGKRARTMITQSIDAAPGTKASVSRGKVVAILAIIGAGAAVGILAATSGGGGGGSAPPPVTPPAAIGITPGTPTITPPQ